MTLNYSENTGKVIDSTSATMLGYDNQGWKQFFWKRRQTTKDNQGSQQCVRKLR